MSADYGKPKPADPLWYRLDCEIHIRCPCGHAVTETLAEFGAVRGLDSRMKLHELIARLRCSKCRRRSPSAEVKVPRH